MFENIFNFIANLFTSFFVDRNQRLGDIVFTAQTPWKLSSLTNTSKGLFIGVYNSDTRRNSKLYRDGTLIYEGNEETIGQGVECDGCVFFAGENGRLLIFSADNKILKHTALNFATTCIVLDKQPYVFDTKNNKIGAINCWTNETEFPVMGSGIVTMAAVHRGNLYTAACDGAGGLAGNNTFVGMADCQCVISYAGALLCSRKNNIYEIEDGENIHHITELDCEKIMHMGVSDNLLWVTGSNPDTLWTFDPLMRCKQVARFDEDRTPVGGSVFRTRITPGYFGRCKNGNMAVVYKIEG